MPLRHACSPPARGKVLGLRHKWAMAPAPGRPRGGGGRRSTSYKPGTRSCAEPQFSLLCACLSLKSRSRLLEAPYSAISGWPPLGDSEPWIALSGLDIGAGEVLGWHRMWRHPGYEVRTSAIGGIAPWKAHEVRWLGMVAAVKLSQQPRTESCVVPGNGHCEA
jgi:hypothetical protein